MPFGEHERGCLIAVQDRVTLKRLGDSQDGGGIARDQTLRLDAEHLEVVRRGHVRPGERLREGAYGDRISWQPSTKRPPAGRTPGVVSCVKSVVSPEGLEPSTR